MKVLRLELEGFGPYRARQHIDFGAFDDDIFVITGKTGAGKSTILDAIVFALYDTVPRYDGTEKSVRSDFCTADDPTSVTLEFESGGERYRVTRSPEYMRPKKRHEGLTTQKAEAALWVDRDGEWEALEVQLRDVNRRIGEIMRLTADQFLQVILLAQGRFQEFLQADTKERLAVLRSLFGTARFERLEHHVREVAKERSRAVQMADAALGEIVARAVIEADPGDEGDSRDEPVAAEPSVAERDEWFVTTAAALSENTREAEAARGTAAKAADAATKAFTEATATTQSHAKLATARETVAALEARADSHAADKARLELAKRAAPVATPARAVDAAQAQVEVAAAEHRAAVRLAQSAAVAEVAWPQSLGEIADASQKTLGARVTELAGQVGALSSAVDQELALPRLHEEAVAAGEAVKFAVVAQSEVQAQIEALPEMAQALRVARDVAATSAARVDDLQQALGRTEQAAEAHERAALLVRELEAARKEHEAALTAHAKATEAYNDLVQQRLRSQAAHLAQELVDGEPCAVCGASEHPAPAEPSDTHVTDDEVEAAREVESAAGDALKGAKDAVAEVESNLAVARAAAGEGDADAAKAAVTAALEQLEAARAAAAEQERLETELAELEARETALKEQLAQKAIAVEAARTVRTQALAAVDGARKTVADKRGDYESVLTRARDLERAQELVAGLATAMGVLGDAKAALTQAQASLAGALKEAGFDDVGAAHEALLATADLAALDEAVTKHSQDLAGARAVVASLDVEGLPPLPDNLTELEVHAAAAVSARDEAVAAATAQAARSARFQGLAADYARRASATEKSRGERDVALTLADSLEGSPPNERRMRLESFVLASKLERIVAAANARLTTMSSGQYRLEHDDDRQYRNTQTGLGLRIADAHTGRSRSTRSLSGGETFLASLALALGLAETVTAEAGGIRLSTLFIDEGFGSLDGDTLEVAMSTLDELRSGGRTIGLISHVEAMKEQIPAKLEVEKMDDGSSRVAAVGVSTPMSS